MDVTPAPPSTIEPPRRDDLDADRVLCTDGPVRRLTRVSGPRDPGFAVVIQRSALEAIHAHGQSDTGVEVCGVLVGEVCRDRVSTYLLISAHVEGDKATSKETQVTFTAETWNVIQAAMEKKHVGKKVVGWYHTHPGFGVFLSGMDLFIQDNFFNLPWQVAWVYDPMDGTDGVFVWRAGRSERAEFLIEEDLGVSGHDFRATLPAKNRPSVVAARRSKRARAAQFVLMVLTFLACFAGIWYGMGWMTAHGFRIRLPIER